MIRIVGVALLCLASLDASSQAIKASAQSRLDVEHTKWIEIALRSMETVKAGTTRAELLRIFTEEGGISNPFPAYLCLSPLPLHQSRCQVCAIQ